MSERNNEQAINLIRGKMLIAMATPAEVQAFLRYVIELEVMVQAASDEDFFGSEGWRHRVFG